MITLSFSKALVKVLKQSLADRYDLYIKDDNGKYITDQGYRVTKLYARILIRRKQSVTEQETFKMAAEPSASYNNNNQ